MKVRNIRGNIFIMMLLMMIMLLPGIKGFAEDRMPELDSAEPLKLEVGIMLQMEGGMEIPMPNLVMKACKVADLTEEGGSATYALVEPFQDQDISFEGMSASDSNDAAAVLSQIVSEETSFDVISGTTGMDGVATFDISSPGMYLVQQDTQNGLILAGVKMDPFLVSVPGIQVSDEGNTWQYTVHTYPKVMDIRNTELDNQVGSIEVTKKITFAMEDMVFDLFTPSSTFYVGLFLDEDGTWLYDSSYVKPITIINGNSASVEFDQLMEGVYYVFETDAAGVPMRYGDIYEKNGAAFTCLVEGDGTNAIGIEPGGEHVTGSLTLENRYQTMALADSIIVELNITKKVQDAYGTEIETTEPFYAGIFLEDSDGSMLLDQNVELVVNQPVKAVLQLGGDTGMEPVTYYVYETNENGERVDEATFGYRIEGETAVTFDLSDTSKDVTLINTVMNAAAPAEQETERNGAVAPAEQETERNGAVAPAEQETERNGAVAPAEQETERNGAVAPAEQETERNGAVAPAEQETDAKADNTSTSSTTSQTQTAQSVKTGDQTPVMMWIKILLAALVSAFALLVMRKHSGRSKK